MNQSAIYFFTIFLWLRITIVALVLQLIGYYSTSWVSTISDLVLVLILWFRIIKCGWFFIMGIIANIFLKIRNGWAIVVKYVTTAVYVGSHFFAQVLENSRSHSNACNKLIFSKNTHQLNGKGIDNSTESMSGITDDHQNYEKCECSDRCIKKRIRERKIKLKISKTSNLWLKIGVFTICSSSSHFSVYFPATRIALE